MYQLQNVCADAVLATAPHVDNPSDPAQRPPVVLLMQENRSHLSRDARLCFSVIGFLFMITSTAPARERLELVEAALAEARGR